MPLHPDKRLNAGLVCKHSERIILSSTLPERGAFFCHTRDVWYATGIHPAYAGKASDKYLGI